MEMGLAIYPQQDQGDIGHNLEQGMQEINSNRIHGGSPLFSLRPIEDFAERKARSARLHYRQSVPRNRNGRRFTHAIRPSDVV